MAGCRKQLRGIGNSLLICRYDNFCSTTLNTAFVNMLQQLFPAMFFSGFPGNRSDAKRAGMMTTKFFTIDCISCAIFF